LRSSENLWIAGEPHKASLSQDTGCPTITRTLSQARHNSMMKRMVRPRQREQNVGVQQKCFHSSSQARRMARSEIIGVSSGSPNLGKRLPPLSSGGSVV